MVNTRSKIKKTKNTHETHFLQASIDDSNHQSTQSGALIGSNDDLLTEIFLRLPITSILQFKSVSKHWRWLLSHTRFTSLYDRLSKSPGIFIRDMYIPFDVKIQSTPPSHNLDFYNDPYGIIIMQSCNGLLLCCSGGGNVHTRKYYVFNPTTKQFAIIPPIPGGHDVCETICLAFHQTDCVHYKVVCIRNIDCDEEFLEIQIYSSDTQKWKISIKSVSADHYTPFSYGVYWNGAIHWTPYSRSTVYFKINDEQLQTVALPVKVVYSGGMLKHFGESRGHLHLVETGDRENHLLYVFEMLSDCSGWFVKHRIEMNEVARAFPVMIGRSNYRFHVSDVVRGENEEDSFMVLMISGKLIRYNVCDKSFESIFNFTDDLFEGHYGAHRYIESIASL